MNQSLCLGGGFEPEVHYPQWRRVHKPIDRHQVLMDSLCKLVEGMYFLVHTKDTNVVYTEDHFFSGCNDVTIGIDKWLSKLESSNWLSHIKDVLNCACLVAQCIDQEGRSKNLVNSNAAWQGYSIGVPRCTADWPAPIFELLLTLNFVPLLRFLYTPRETAAHTHLILRQTGRASDSPWQLISPIFKIGERYEVSVVILNSYSIPKSLFFFFLNQFFNILITLDDFITKLMYTFAK